MSWTRFGINALRLHLHVLAHDLANFARALALPKSIESWSPVTSLGERLIKTGTRLVRHGRYALCLMAEAALPRSVFRASIDRINALRGRLWRRRHYRASVRIEALSWRRRPRHTVANA